MLTIKVAVIRSEWKTKSSNASANAPAWSDNLFQEVFQRRNGWSLGSYWDDASLGTFSPQFEFIDLGVLDAVQETLTAGALLDKVVDAARRGGKLTGRYDRYVAFMWPPPNPSSSPVGFGSVLDGNGPHFHFAHELGHAFDLRHPFGWGPGGTAVEYGDAYCVMGFSDLNSFGMTAAALGPADNAALPASFWKADRHPSPATLFAWRPDFRVSPLVRTVPVGTNGLFTLTAVSEYKRGGNVLIRIPIGQDQEYFLEYRNPSGWDRGLKGPAVVIHSRGLPTHYGPGGKGWNQVWFERVMLAPFQDAWRSPNSSVGVEVVGLWSSGEAITVRITSPAAVKSASLGENPNRVEGAASVSDSGVLLLNAESDPNLCEDTVEPYSVKILRFGEEIRLTLIVDGFAQRVVESWRVGHQLLPPNASSQPVYTSVISTVTAIVRPPAPALARLDKTTQFAVASLVVTTSGSSIAISAAPGAGRFELPVEAIVRDAAELPGVPAAVRVARGTVTFDGERIEYDDNYVHDAEGCWLRRLQRGTRYLERYEPGPIAPPPWLKQADSMLIPRMKERQLVPRPGPRRSEMKPKGPGQ